MTASSRTLCPVPGNEPGMECPVSGDEVNGREYDLILERLDKLEEDLRTRTNLDGSARELRAYAQGDSDRRLATIETASRESMAKVERELGGLEADLKSEIGNRLALGVSLDKRVDGLEKKCITLAGVAAGISALWIFLTQVLPWLQGLR